MFLSHKVLVRGMSTSLHTKFWIADMITVSNRVKSCVLLHVLHSAFV